MILYGVFRKYIIATVPPSHMFLLSKEEVFDDEAEARKYVEEIKAEEKITDKDIRVERLF